MPGIEVYGLEAKFHLPEMSLFVLKTRHVLPLAKALNGVIEIVAEERDWASSSCSGSRRKARLFQRLILIAQLMLFTTWLSGGKKYGLEM